MPHGMARWDERVDYEQRRLMTDALFHIIAIVVAVLGVVRGYRRGLTGMVTSVLGLAFGVVCAHIFCEGAAQVVENILPAGITARSGYYLTSNVGAGAVYFIVYRIFCAITKVIREALDSDQSGLLNSLLGAFFCVGNYLLMLSIAYNIGVGINPTGQLMRHGRADDGNIIEAVMWIAPAALGSESFSEFALEEQLRHARTISQSEARPEDCSSNHPGRPRVIVTDNKSKQYCNA